MNFQKIPEIKPCDHYLDVSFRSARSSYKKVRGRSRSEENIAKKKALSKITTINDRLSQEMEKICKDFPRYEKLSPFYKDLFKCYFDIDQYKKDLGRANWLKGKVKQFSGIYAKKVKTSRDKKVIDDFLKQYYGRISSFFYKAKGAFKRLEEMRKKLRKMPDFKEDCYTVALFGFPNVGKSTLLSKITTATPQIANYAFTTKKINAGYRRVAGRKIQFFDTPGTLNRFERMNDIEKQAYLVVTKLADLIVYIYDPSETYPLKDQKALRKKVKGKVINFCSKMDLFPDNEIFKKEKCVTKEQLLIEIEKLAIEKELKELREN